MIYKNIFDKITTMEALYTQATIVKDTQSAIINKENLIIPYINLAISNHKLNPSSELKYINFCYVVCENVVFVKRNNELVFENDGVNFDKYSFTYLSGVDFKNENRGFHELSILCENSYIKTIDRSTIQPNEWGMEDLKKDDVLNFINLDYFDNNILEKYII